MGAWLLGDSSSFASFGQCNAITLELDTSCEAGIKQDGLVYLNDSDTRTQSTLTVDQHAWIRCSNALVAVIERLVLFFVNHVSYTSVYTLIYHDSLVHMCFVDWQVCIPLFKFLSIKVKKETMLRYSLRYCTRNKDSA